eukprot:scaffold3218_cov24-Tisochrysis_lutea.AAC.1
MEPTGHEGGLISSPCHPACAGECTHGLHNKQGYTASKSFQRPQVSGPHHARMRARLAAQQMRDCTT